MDMDGLSDQSLVRAAHSGDGPAFAALVSRHYPLLLASCRRMLANVDLARDAAQEAALRAMLGLDHLRDDARFGPWLVGIGLNVCRGLGTGRRQVSFEALREGGQLAEPMADHDEPVAVVAAHELTVRVREAIAALPAGQREAVALFYIDGLTQAEAARELGTRPGAIKTRLHKARRSLRASLRDTYEEYIDMTERDTPADPDAGRGATTNPDRRIGSRTSHRLLGRRAGTTDPDLDRPSRSDCHGLDPRAGRPTETRCL